MIKLHPYQEVAKNFIVTHPKCGLFLKMGMGKTLVTLKALEEIKPQGHILIVAPKNIARSTWLDEIAKWKIPVRTESLIVTEKGRPLTRQQRLELYKSIPDKPPSMWFINRELLPDLINNMPVINKKPVWYFPTVIIDELQSFKSYNSVRFKALKTVSPCITRFIGLTGTPTPKSLMDLWSEIYLMDGGKRLGKNITAYRNTFFNPGRIVNGYPVEWIPKPGAEEEIYRRIKDLVISIKNTNLKLPPITYNDINVYMSDSELKKYKKLAKTQVLNINEDTTVTAVNAGVLKLKLRQMASGALYINDNHEYVVIHKQKCEQCEYIINNTDSPVIIAYYFKSDKEMLIDYLQNAGIDARIFDGSPEMIKDWNARKIPVMLLQPASAGHGLNLQQGGSTLIWYTLPTSLEHYLQTIARLHRQGQTDPVVIHHIFAHDTIDASGLDLLDSKNMTEEKLISAVELAIQTALEK